MEQLWYLICCHACLSDEDQQPFSSDLICFPLVINRLIEWQTGIYVGHMWIVCFLSVLISTFVIAHWFCWWILYPLVPYLPPSMRRRFSPNVSPSTFISPQWELWCRVDWMNSGLDHSFSRPSTAHGPRVRLFQLSQTMIQQKNCTE